MVRIHLIWTGNKDEVFSITVDDGIVWWWNDAINNRFNDNTKWEIIDQKLQTHLLYLCD